jgi:hypothetical protein
MRLPPSPAVGLVVSYAYLWADEAEAGRAEGIKDRPAAIVLARKDLGPSEVVYVVPITHAPPRAGEEHKKVLIPERVRRHLGLDDDASWIDVTELNVFVWPGPDLRPVPRRGRGDDDPGCFYGFLPASLFRAVKRQLELNWSRGRARAVKR